MRRDDAAADAPGERRGAPRVAHFDRREANALEVGEELYVFLDEGEPALVPARCPHRGGPLHFATVEKGAQGDVLVCPWHGTKVPLRALLRRAAATVQSGDSVHVVVDARDGAAVIPRHVPIRFAPDGACARACADGATKGSSRS